MVTEDATAEGTLRRAVHRRACAALTWHTKGAVAVGGHSEGARTGLRLRLRTERTVTGAKRTIVDTATLHVTKGTVTVVIKVVITVVVNVHIPICLCPCTATRLIDITATVAAVVPATAHARMRSTVARSIPTTAVVPRTSSVAVPRVTTIVGEHEVRATEEEIVAVRIACVDAEMPETIAPIERTIEVRGIAVSAILPVEQDVAQVEVALPPVNAVEVIIVVYTHEVVKIDLIGCFILLIGEIKLVSHLIRQKKSLIAGLVITHGRSAQRDSEQECECCKEPFHTKIIMAVIGYFSLVLHVFMSFLRQ